jgi:hypothetical protein
MKRLIKIAALLLVVPALGRSQDLNEQPRTLAHVFAGFATHRMALNAGFGAEFRLYKGLAVGPEFDAAGIGGRANSDPASNPNIIGLGSLDASYHFYNKAARGRLAPFVAGGYTAFFGQDTGTPSGSLQHGYNVGGGVDLFASKHVGVRFDVRHYGHGGRILWASFPADCGAYPLMPSPCELSFTAIRFALTFR